MPDTEVDFKFFETVFADKRKILAVIKEEYGDSYGSFVIDCPLCGGKKMMKTKRDRYDFKAFCSSCYIYMEDLGW